MRSPLSTRTPRRRVHYAAAFALLLSCDKPTKEALSSAASTTGARPTEAAPIAPDAADAPADAAEEALRRLIASAASIDQGADGTRLGAAVELRLVKRYTDMNGSTQHVVVVLIASGNGAIVAEIDDLGEDGADNPPGTLVAIAPLDPPGKTRETEVGVPLPVHGTVLYSESFHIPGANDHVVVVHRGDRVLVYSFWEDEGSRADAWRLRAEVELAPHARVVAR